jgi:cysteine synthase A
LVGNTPLIYLKSLSTLCGCEIYAKGEFLNPSGSMKDRTALAIITGAIRYELVYILNIAEASWVTTNPGSTREQVGAPGLV